MKTKIFSYLAWVAFSFLALVAVVWIGAGILIRHYSPSPKIPPMTMADVRQTLEKCSCEPAIQAEVDSLFSQPGDKVRSWDDVDLSTAPGLARFGNALSDNPEWKLNTIWYIAPSDLDEIGVPTHVEIRFGQHFHYQYILIFRTGSDLSSIKSPFERITNNIYFNAGACCH